jgi:hypothetical protein
VLVHDSGRSSTNSYADFPNAAVRAFAHHHLRGPWSVKWCALTAYPPAKTRPSSSPASKAILASRWWNVSIPRPSGHGQLRQLLLPQLDQLASGQPADFRPVLFQ